MLQVALHIGGLRSVSSVFDEDVESGGILALLRELDVVVLLPVCAVGQQHFDYLQQKLADIVDEFVTGLEVFLELDAAALDDFIVEDQFALDWVVGHEVAAGLQTGLVLFLVGD